MIPVLVVTAGLSALVVGCAWAAIGARHLAQAKDSLRKSLAWYEAAERYYDHAATLHREALDIHAEARRVLMLADPAMRVQARGGRPA